MNKTTTNEVREEARFLDVLTACWTKACRDGADGAQSRFREHLRARLGIDDRRVTALVSGFEALAEYVVGDLSDGDALDEEESAIAASRKVVLPALQARIQARLDRIDASKPVVCCTCCGQPAPSEGFRTRSWDSTLGTLRLTRRYNYCAACGGGRALAQERVGLGEDPRTPRLAEAITKLATVVPYQMAVGLASSLMGVDVSVRAAERLVNARAEHVVAAITAEAEQLDPFDASGLQRRIERPADAVARPPTTAYLEMDGVFAMTRQLDPDRSRPADPGARGGHGRRYQMLGREVKNAVLYTDADCARESPTRGCLLDKRYVSHLGPWREFARRVWPTLIRLRFDQAERLVVLSDGARWIRDFCAWLPFKVLMILDLFHVKHRIWEVARALHPDDPTAAARWAHEQIDRVERGRADAVVQSLGFLRAAGATARKLVEDLQTYLRNNLDRMDYPSYRAMGLRVGSGAVESANYHVTGSRLKLQGMRWSDDGAGDMAVLRADLFNGNWRARTREMLAA